MNRVTSIFSSMASKAPAIVMKTSEPEVFYSLIKEGYAKFLKAYNAAFRRDVSPADIKLILWDQMGGLRPVDTDGFDVRCEPDLKPAGSVNLDVALNWLLQKMQEEVYNLQENPVNASPLPWVVVLKHTRFSLMNNPGMARNILALENLLNYINKLYSGAVRLVIAGDVDSLPPTVSGLTIAEDCDHPDRGEIECILEGTLNIQRESLPSTLVDALLGLDYRRACVVATQVKARWSDPDAAVRFATEAKVKAIKASAPWVTFIPPSNQMPPLVGFDRVLDVARRIKAVMDHPEMGVPPAENIFAMGEKGTGKSTLVEAVAGILEAPIVIFNFGDMLNSLLGSSEQRLRDVIQTVNALGRCVVMLDEVEKQAPNLAGSASDGGTKAGMFSSVLSWMQDCWNQKRQVVFVATANTAVIQNLPPEFFSRFTHRFVVYPPTNDVLGKIFAAHLDKLEGNETYDVGALATQLVKVSGAQRPVGRDVVQVIRSAQGEAVIKRSSAIPTQQDVMDAIANLRSGMVEIADGIFGIPLGEDPKAPASRSSSVRSSSDGVFVINH